MSDTSLLSMQHRATQRNIITCARCYTLACSETAQISLHSPLLHAHVKPTHCPNFPARSPSLSLISSLLKSKYNFPLGG